MADKNEAMENLFKAIDIITQERLTNLGYDKTIKATITDDSNADKGEYTVSDGSSDFIAYSNVKYSVGTIVYVIIPQGDYDNTKLIVGKYTDENSTYNYVSPSDDFLDITHNLVTNVSEDAALLANDPDDRFCTVWKADGLNYQGYNRLALKGNFRTWLSSLDVINGTYGLMLYVVSKEISYSGNDFERTYKFNLSSEDMYGNPFNFETYYLQEKVFDISNIPDIISMELIFYQNCDFMTADGILADYQENKENHLKNLFVQAPPYVSLGYDIDDVVEDEVKLYTLDATTYDATYEELTRQKTLNLRWIHVRDDGSIIAIDQEDEIPENAEIRWYKYQLDRAVCDKVAGTFWSEIAEARNKFSYTFSPDIVVASEKYKVIIECPSRASVYQSLKGAIDKIGDNELNDGDGLVVKDPDTGKIMLESQVVGLAAKSYLDNSLKSFQEYKQIIEEYNTSWQIKNNTTANYPNYEEIIIVLDDISRAQADVRLYRSEIVEFTNESYDPVSAAIDLISGLEILIDAAGYNGSYLIYDESGMITNSAESMRKRILTASYSSLITGEELLDRAENIIWYFPLESTMIYPPQRGTEYSDYDYYSELTAEEIAALDLPCGYCRIERAIPEVTEGQPGEEMARQVEQYFRIKDYYTQTAVNNTIYCTVFKNNQEYKASATLTFGTSGTNGTEATFRLELREVDEVGGGLKPSDRPASALTIGDTVAVVPRIYDYNNEDITDEYLKKHFVSYSWYGKNQDPDKGVILEAPLTNSENRFALLKTDAGTTIDKCQYYILTASVYWTVVKYEYDDSGNLVLDIDGNPKVKETNGDIESRDVQLKTFLPIPVRISNEYTQVVGPTQIIYDSNGTNPTYYKMPFKLYKDGSVIEANWQSACLEYGKNKTNANVLKFYPYLDAEGNLTPTNMYLANDYPFAIEAVYDGQIVWTQPILIIKNKYSSAMLNSWDGDFIVNEENGTIMGTMFGAGKKDVNNTFTGVLMGDIEAGAGLKDGNKSGIGLYGFHQSEQSFGFNIDGTAFIGKAGRGRISMNGNKGTIQSGSYQQYSHGMQIDLDGIDSYSASLSAYGPGGSFELNTNTSSSLLEIRSGPAKDDGVLLHIGNSKNEDFYLQSWDYNGTSKGTRLDLETGDYSTYADNGSYVKISPKGNPYFQIYDVGGTRNIFYASKSDFYLQSANYEKANKGMHLDLRNGAIDARSGYIGGWTINKSTLTGGAMEINSEGSMKGGSKNAWWIDAEGNASFAYLAATGGSIGPFKVSKTELSYDGGSSFTIGQDGLNLNGNFKVARDGSTYIGGNLTVAGTSTFKGTTNITDGGKIQSSSTGTNGNRTWGFNSASGNLGPWIVDNNGFHTEGDEYSCLGMYGTMILASSKSKFEIGSGFIKFTTDKNDAFNIASGLSYNTDNGIFEVQKDHVRIRAGSDSYGYISLTESGVWIGGNKGATVGYLELGMRGAHLVGGGGGAGAQLILDSDQVSLGTTDRKNTLEMTHEKIMIDGQACTGDLEISIGALLNSKTGKLKFHKGLLVDDGNKDLTTDTDTKITLQKDLVVKGHISAYKKGTSSNAVELGKLAWMDKVEVTNASFKIGGSSLSFSKNSTSGNTATYSVTIPGQTAGSSGSAYAYAWVDKNDRLHVICTTGSAPSGYRQTTNKATDYDSCTVSSSGTTNSRTLTASITVEATTEF